MHPSRGGLPYLIHVNFEVEGGVFPAGLTIVCMSECDKLCQFYFRMTTKVSFIYFENFKINIHA